MKNMFAIYYKPELANDKHLIDILTELQKHVCHRYANNLSKSHTVSVTVVSEFTENR